MADYNIKADITANTKGYEAGIKKAQESTKKFSTSLSKVIQGLGKNGLVGAMGSIGLASAGLSATLGAVVKIAKQVSQTIGECTEAYKKQLIAERQLETAINNNPLVTGSAKKRLTEFANEMQKVSNYGDEELIPMMANLVSLGRTEEETMKIMSVAMDMSASGSMTLDTAITQLNATLNGNIGRLGQQNAELKGLTEEELKSGKAVEILGEKFKGLAQSTVDTSKQLKNIKGDFKEAIGEFTLPSSDMWNKFWIGFYEKGISVIKQFDEYMDKTIIGKGIAEELIKGYKSISDERQKVLYLEDNIHALSESQIVALQKHLESTKNRNKEQEELLRKVKMEVESRKYLAKIYADMEKDEAQRKKTEEEQLAIENEIAILKGKYLEKIAEQERKWQNIKDVTGEQVSNEEKIKFYQDSLVDLMTQAGGQITTNNQLYKDQMAIIEKLAEGLEKQKKALADISSWESKLRQQSIEALSNQNRETEDYEKKKRNLKEILDLSLQQLDAQLNADLKSVEDTENVEEAKTKILEYYNNEKLALQKDFNEQVADIQREQEEEAWREQKAQYQKMAQTLLNYTSKIENAFVSMARKIGAVVRSAIGKMFSGAKGGLGKLFDLNPDTALEGLLKLEDKILTFFMETLPKIPQFIASALQSVSVMMSTIKLNIDKKQIRAMIKNIMTTVKMFVPDILKVGLEIAREIVEGLAEGIKENAGLIGQVLNDMAQILAQYLPPVVLAIIDAVSKFISAIPDSAIMSLVNGAIDLVIKLASALINNAVAIAEKLIPALFEIILQLFKKLPEILKTVLWEVIKGLGKVASFIWEGVKKLFGFETGTNNAPKGLALVGEAGPELVNFKGGERVLNARNTQRALEGATRGNAGNTFNVTFNNLQDTSAYAMMSQLKQYNRQLSINGVI
jgi:hypothetical protein